MIRSVALIILLACSSVAGHAAFETSRTVAPRSPAYDPLAPGPLFWLANPATLSLAAPHLATAYIRPFRLADLETGIAAVNLQQRRFALGIGLTTLGSSSLYRESDFNIAAAVRFGHSFSVGSTIHLLDLRFGAHYSSWQFIASGFGVWYESPSGIGAGISHSDIVIVQPSSRTALTPITRIALSYRYSPPLGLRAGIEHREHWILTCGETLLIAERLHLHADLLTAPLRIVVGARIRTPAGFITITHRSHPELGGDMMIGWGIIF